MTKITKGLVLIFYSRAKRKVERLPDVTAASKVSIGSGKPNFPEPIKQGISETLPFLKNNALP